MNTRFAITRETENVNMIKSVKLMWFVFWTWDQQKPKNQTKQQREKKKKKASIRYRLIAQKFVESFEWEYRISWFVDAFLRPTIQISK